MSAGRGNGMKTPDDLRELCDVEPGANGCWIWQGYTAERGRPSARICGLQALGPRIMAIALGIHEDRPKNKRWTVKCGDALCIAPHHLILATQAQVMVHAAKTGRLKRSPDSVARNRIAAAQRTTTKPAWMVHEAIASDDTAEDVAAKLEVSPTTVKQWRSGKRRAHLVAGPFSQLLGLSA